MKWDDDLYKEEKWDIFEIVRYGLTLQHAENVSIKKLQDSIDALFDALTSTEMDKICDNYKDDEHHLWCPIPEIPELKKEED